MIRKLLLLLHLLSGCSLFAQDSISALSPVQSQFYNDLSTIGSFPHRISGSTQAQKVAEYIKVRLQDMGINTLLKLNIPVQNVAIKKCRIEIGDTTLRLQPLAANLHILPSTPFDGLEGPMIYMADGMADSLWNQDLNNAIVVFEYESQDKWVEAFTLGAQAIIFLGDEISVPTVSKRMGLPTNLIRLYADQEAQHNVELRKNYSKVKIVSHLNYETKIGENILAFLPGTDPDFVQGREVPELLVISANFDSWGEVPEKCPAARSAANVAAVLNSAEYFIKHRPKRDLLFIFCDNQANFHQGMRGVYDAITRPPEMLKKIASDHNEEYEYLSQLKKMLTSERTMKDEQGKLHLDVKKIFFKNAEFVYADLNQLIMKLRIDSKKAGLPEPDPSTGYKEKLESKIKWSKALEIINDLSLDGIDAEVFETLRKKSLHYISGRLSELDLLRKIDKQEKGVRDLIGNHWIVLHTEYNFSDLGTLWAPVVGDKSEFQFYPKRNLRSQWDNPGWYHPVLNAFKAASENTPNLKKFNSYVLSDPLLTQNFVPGEYIFGSVVAGINGFFNVGFMTHHDGRLREGHPSDNLKNLNWKNIEVQAKEAGRLLYTLANGEDISIPQAFKSHSVTYDRNNKLPLWNKGRSTGFFTGLMVSGSLTETRPAAGAIMAQCANGEWHNYGPYKYIPGFNQFGINKVNANGNFEVTGYHKDLWNVRKKEQIAVVPAMFDSLGQITAIITDKSWRDKIDQMDIFPAQGYIIPVAINAVNVSRRTLKNETKILKASANAVFREDRHFKETTNIFTIFYIHRFIPGDRVKIFQPLGSVCLGASPDEPYGEGVFFDKFVSPPPIDRMTAEDLWRLNETRLSILRSKGVINSDLEVLHNRAKRTLDEADSASTVKGEQTLLAQSAAVSRQVYNPVKETMNDLIQAIVILLLLAIPFAFALERLIICATSIYMRITGFIVAFFITFLLLYFMHPGFSIAATPIVVFLAFIIIVLSSLVIFIMIRKFKTELMAFQMRSTAAHSAEISRMGTMLAAMSMGMSTMRRRPTRTLLTCITVIILTFTVLCFASFGTRIGVKSAYEGPVTGEVAGGFFLRKLDYSVLSRGLINLLKGREGKNGLIAGHWWKVKEEKQPKPFDIARIDNGKAIFTDALLGLSPEELYRWKQLADVLNVDSLEEKVALLRAGGVFLPSLISDEIKLVPGDSLWLDGHRTFFAGDFDVSKLQKLKHLDGRSILPVDFADETYDTLKSDVGGTGDVDLVQRDFIRLNGNQTAIASDSIVKRLGGNLHTLVVYPDKEISIEEEGVRIAELTYLPAWIKGKDGIKRLVFTKLTGISGAFALLIPILLGGFIIFGTLLGSITDREKEIYTFSALGLSPGHVGFLFLAEAGIYAIIGGMGGQILAQAIAIGASFLADLGLIHQPSINFSSSNSIFAIVVVMLTVLGSAIYPAMQASKSANPGVKRGWKMPEPENRVLQMTFPFTVSRYDLTGVVSFLAEHFREHEDAGIGVFAAADVTISQKKDTGNLVLSAHLSLAPFDLGISQDFRLMATPSEIEGIDEISIRAEHRSGAIADWKRSNKVFLHELRKQFLLWRTISATRIEQYRMETLQLLEEVNSSHESA